MAERDERDEWTDREAEDENYAINMALGSTHMDGRDKRTIKKHIQQCLQEVKGSTQSGYDPEFPYGR